MDHLPSELAQLMEEFQTKIKQGIELKDEIPYLEKLADHYKSLYEQDPTLWTAGLRAQSLYVACHLRDGHDDSIYSQSAYRMMKSSLSTGELSKINTENRNRLHELRIKHKNLTSNLKSQLSNIDTEDWSHNAIFIHDFVKSVRCLSDQTTHDVVNFLGSLFDQCIESLGKPPPCGIAVVAIGSLARCETTSYSDVEYMFIIEQDSKACLEYFDQFAMQSYYFLGMLGESNLKTFSIQELKSVSFEDRCRKGIRIDGLGLKAGNIPTGNGLDRRNRLTFSVNQLVQRCQEIMQGEHEEVNKGVPSDLVDMITHRSLIWSYGNGPRLYEMLNQRLRQISPTKERREKSLNLLREDLNNYNFLPKLTTLHSGHQEVKDDIYRYLSLLPTGLANILNLKCQTNWETIEKLLSRQICTQEVGEILSFLLASALFIRMDCYLFYNEQKDRVTLFENENESTSSQYSCPCNLFILMMSYLFPLKRWMYQILAITPNDIKIGTFSQDTFTAVSTTYSYCDANGKVVREYIKRYGEDALFNQPERLLTDLTSDQCHILLLALSASHMTERHVRLVEAAIKIYPNSFGEEADRLKASCYVDTNPREALRHALTWLVKIPKGDLKNLWWAELLISQCYRRCGKWDSSENSLYIARQCVEKMEELNMYTRDLRLTLRGGYLHRLGELRYQQESYTDCIRLSLEALDYLGEKLHGPDVIHNYESALFNNIGSAYNMLGNTRESLKYLNRSLAMLYKLHDSDENRFEIAATLLNIGCAYILKGEYQQALDCLERSRKMLHEIYADITPTHPDLTLNLCHIAVCHREMGNYKEALQHYTQALAQLTKANVVNKHNLAVVTLDMAFCYMNSRDFTVAIDNFNQSMEFYTDINQDGKYDKKIAEIRWLILICQTQRPLTASSKVADK